MKEKEHDLKDIFSRFVIEGDYLSHKFLKVGHINDTYLVEASNRGNVERYIFQRINHYVFRDPERLMSNFEKITRHIRAKLERTPGSNPDRQTLNLAPTKSGKSYHLSPDGDFWRAYRYVGDCYIINIAEKPGQAGEPAAPLAAFRSFWPISPPHPFMRPFPFFIILPGA